MRFDPAGYPGPRPTGPVLVEAGRVHPLVLDGPPQRPWRRADGGRVPVSERLRLSVAYGANAAPSRLIDKGLDRRGVVLLPARLRGWVPAFEARRTGYGAVPLTLVPAADPETLVDTFVLGVDVDDLAVLDRSEGRAPTRYTPRETADDVRTAPHGTYVLGRVGPVTVAERFLLADALAYRPGPGTRLLTRHGDWLTWPSHSQAEAVAALEAGAVSRPAPPTQRVVEGDWPSTPLDWHAPG